MMKTEPDIEQYLRQFEENYEKLNYTRNLSSRVLSHSHQVLEKAFSQDDHFSRVLEVGAGSAQHPKYLRHRFDEYWITDNNKRMLDQARLKHGDDQRFKFGIEDASALSFEKNSFDRVIATHVLEHIPDPHIALRNWADMVKPNGVLSLVLPCDPGLAWRLGRHLGVRRRATEAGLDYDYWMAREHINSIYNLVTFINYYFEDVDQVWWPLRIPSADLNLIYAVNIRL